MALLVLRTGFRTSPTFVPSLATICRRYKSEGSSVPPGDLPGPFGHAIKDEYARIRDNYQTPENPIVLAHGLFGFDQLHLAGSIFPGLHYWRGITTALEANGIEVITASVPASGSIEKRAQKLSEDIEKKAGGKSVNIVARHERHAGKPKADESTANRLPKIYKVLDFINMETGAFSQLTRKYMREDFNPRTPDREGVRYFSYGATFEPSLWSSFRYSHGIVEKEEGPNDGLVSVESSKWGGDDGYKGTLIGVSHLDLINWTSRLRWYFWELTGNKRDFNAIAFYLDIGDMLAKEGY
ncbi:MAG: hypothetical protein LQ347_001012 [Umbilicaria vellea]|nr:MAG: hypothetical protein LQ347_001012 [Umbilicaria vellea]